jgi:hypothetical protein
VFDRAAVRSFSGAARLWFRSILRTACGSFANPSGPPADRVGGGRLAGANRSSGASSAARIEMTNPHESTRGSLGLVASAVPDQPDDGRREVGSVDLDVVVDAGGEDVRGLRLE